MAEIGINRCELLNDGQRCRFILTHQRPLGHQRTADTSRDRRGHGGISQIQFRHLDIGRRYLTGRLRTLLRCLRRIKIQLAHRLDADQRLVTPDHGTGFGQRRLGLGQFALGACQRSLERCRINLEQQLTRLDIAPLLEMPTEDDSRHPGTHLGHTHRLDSPRQFTRQGKQSRLDGQRFHLGQRWLPRHLLSTTSRLQEDCEQDEHKKAPLPHD